MKKVVLASIALALGGGMSAHAATTTSSAQILTDFGTTGFTTVVGEGPSSSNLDLVPGAQAPLALDLFDGSLGTLNSAVLTLTIDISTDFEIENTGGSVASVDLTTNTVGFVQNSSLSSLVPNGREVSGQATEAVTLQAADGNPGAGSDFLASTYTDSFTEQVFFLGAPDLNFLTGGANDDFLLEYAINAATGTLTAGGNFDLDQTTTAQITASIEYNFTPNEIPVPAALPLMLTGLAGLGFMGWRRRKS